MKGDPVVTGGRIASLGLFLEAVPLVGEFHDDPLVLKPTILAGWLKMDNARYKKPDA